MSVKDETRYSNLLRAELERQCKALTEKLHGSVFQEGLPDLLIGGIDGRITMVELKNGHPHGPVAAINMMRGRQKGVCVRWAMRGCPVFIAGTDDGNKWWTLDLRTCKASVPESEWKFKDQLTISQAALEILYD